MNTDVIQTLMTLRMFVWLYTRCIETMNPRYVWEDNIWVDMIYSKRKRYMLSNCCTLYIAFVEANEDVISTLQSRTEEEEAKIRELEKALKREKDRSEKLETDMITYKVGKRMMI